MLRKKYIYGVDGEISQIYGNECAEIKFNLEDATEFALLKRGRYYHDGRLIPENVPLSNYIRKGMRVKFSCHVLDRQDTDSFEQFQHHVTYSWYAMMCWSNRDSSSSSKPKCEVSVSTGLVSVPGMVASMTKRHGVLTMLDNSRNEHSIAFLASKVYLHGKRFPSSKMLSSQLNIYDEMFFDAIPSIPQEDKDNCRYFATCVFLGKRPRMAQSMELPPVSCNDFQTNFLVNAAPKIGDGNARNNDGTQENKSAQSGQQNSRPTNCKSQLLKMINLHANNPRALFSSGYGYIFDILNDEFGIILGCFRSNVFQTILFHRKNAFLFTVCLARAKLSEIFVEGDRMRFIAVGAPTGFVTDWIAVQVAVAASPLENGDTRSM